MTGSPPVPRVAVVGGGMAGLAAALRLVERARAERAPLAVTVLEAEPVLGGKVRTDRTAGLVIEQGPDSLNTQKPHGVELARHLGLGADLVEPAAGRTYVVWDGRLQPMPEGLVLGVPVTRAGLWRSPLISWWGKLRASLEPAVPPRRVGGDESIAGFLRRRLGREVADRLAAPLLAGIASGDPERLSVDAVFPQLRRLEQEAGSLVRGLRRRRPARPPGGSGRPARPAAPYLTLRGGLDRLPAAAAERIRSWGGRLRAGVRVRQLDARAGGYRVVAAGGGAERFDGIVLAVPAWEAAELLESLVPDAAGELAAIAYKTTVVVALAYPREAVGRLDGSGFIVPVAEEFFVTGCTWLSAKWPGTAPPGVALLRAFVGRWGGDESLLALDDAEIVDRVRRDLGTLMGISAAPLQARVYRWPRGMPQYEVGHLDRLARITAALQEHPRLVVAGAGYRGVGVPDCVRQGQEAADRLWNVLRPAGAGAAAVSR